MIISMGIELDTGDNVEYDEEVKEFYINYSLLAKDSELTLFCNKLGDELGKVTVVSAKINKG